MITIACCLWGANANSFAFSRHYAESDVEKLYRGFKRHLSAAFRFVCFVDTLRVFEEAEIEQKAILAPRPIGYAAMTEPYRLNEPMILCGLDTIVTGDCDALADYCMSADKIAVPRDPFFPEKVCNGVALVPGGMRAAMYDAHTGENDMAWVRAKHAAGEIAVIDDLFPGKVASFKGATKKEGLGDARLVYFHGREKPAELMHIGWIARHWV